mgnify:CR=1 FL=1
MLGVLADNRGRVALPFAFFVPFGHNNGSPRNGRKAAVSIHRVKGRPVWQLGRRRWPLRGNRADAQQVPCFTTRAQGRVGAFEQTAKGLLTALFACPLWRRRVMWAQGGPGGGEGRRFSGIGRNFGIGRLEET